MNHHIYIYIYSSERFLSRHTVNHLSRYIPSHSHNAIEDTDLLYTCFPSGSVGTRTHTKRGSFYNNTYHAVAYTYCPYPH